MPDHRPPLLPFGNGRSYGDSCLNPSGTIIDSRGLDRFISVDCETGVLRCEAGVLLSEILRLMVPRGWFLPVTPGTRFVTLGGAIANDIHGKNHHHAGSFGHHVRRFELLRSDGSRLMCSASENADWFAATIGGLGLTGLILWAEIVLKPISGPAMEVETLRFSNVDEFLDLSHASHNQYEYTVSWIDCMRPAGSGPRGLFFRGNHANGAARRVAPPRPKPGIPFTPPISLVPKHFVIPFNALTYHKPRRRQSHAHYESFFYPLDALPNWNRLFGRRGFYQYQCVVPYEDAKDSVTELVDCIASASGGSVLSVLKVFGDQSPCGWLSFPRPGVTLAMDVPDRGTDTLKLLDRLDGITFTAGGAVYPAKDARMSATAFRRGFPRWQEFEAYRDPAFMSSFWQRVAGTSPCPTS